MDSLSGSILPASSSGSSRFVQARLALSTALFVEVRRVGSRGVSWQEIGYDKEGQIAHRMPSAGHRHGDYGLFDSAAVSFDLSNDRCLANRLRS